METFIETTTQGLFVNLAHCASIEIGTLATDLPPITNFEARDLQVNPELLIRYQKAYGVGLNLGPYTTYKSIAEGNQKLVSTAPAVPFWTLTMVDGTKYKTNTDPWNNNVI